MYFSQQRILVGENSKKAKFQPPRSTLLKNAFNMTIVIRQITSPGSAGIIGRKPSCSDHGPRSRSGFHRPCFSGAARKYYPPGFGHICIGTWHDVFAFQSKHFCIRHLVKIRTAKKSEQTKKYVKLRLCEKAVTAWSRLANFQTRQGTVEVLRL